VKTTVEVPLTQYLRPDGRRRAITADVDIKLGPKVRAILDKGYRFTAEELSGLGVSLCIENDEEDLAVEVAENGPGSNSPRVALERLISKFKLEDNNGQD